MASAEDQKSAVKHIGVNDGDSCILLGTQTLIKVSSRETSGAFCVGEGVIPPNAAIPLHYHRDIELFVVLEGALEILGMTGNDVRALPVVRGEMALVPSNVPHGFRNTSGRDAHLLIIAGAGIEAFLREAAAQTSGATARPPADPEAFRRMVEIAKRHGQVFVDLG